MLGQIKKLKHKDSSKTAEKLNTFEILCIVSKTLTITDYLLHDLLGFEGKLANVLHQINVL